MRLEDLDPVQTQQIGEAPEKFFFVYLKDVVVELGGFCLRIDSFGVRRGHMEAIIGGNGAGKTTLCDVISGKTPVTRGQVFLDGREITKKSESEIASAGVGRKFQTPTVFDSLTVRENLDLAHHGSNGNWWSAFQDSSDEEKEAVEKQMERMSLLEERNKQAGLLSHGKRQWLELSMLILSGCRLLLVDEPAAGLDDTEVTMTAEILIDLQTEHTIIVIEHNLHFVQRLGAMVNFLDQGKVLLYGAYEYVQSDKKVVKSYFGADLDNEDEQRAS